MTTATARRCALIEFVGVKTGLTFQGAFPERPTPAFHEVDPLTVMAEAGCGVPEAIDIIAQEIAGLGAAELVLAANCRGTALLVPLARRLAAHSVAVTRVVAVEPVSITADDLGEALSELARGLSVPQIKVPANPTPDTAKALIPGWVTAFFRTVLGSDAGDPSLYGDLTARYLAWIEYHCWAAEGVRGSFASVPVYVVSTAERMPGRATLEHILGSAAEPRLLTVPGQGSALTEPEGITTLRRLALGLATGAEEGPSLPAV